MTTPEEHAHNLNSCSRTQPASSQQGCVSSKAVMFGLTWQAGAQAARAAHGHPRQAQAEGGESAGDEPNALVPSLCWGFEPPRASGFQI